MNKKILIPLVLLAVLLIVGMGWMASGYRQPKEAESTPGPVAAAPTSVPTPAPTPDPTPAPTPVPHEHQWQDGVCAICGEDCPHERHDAQSGVCKACGVKVEHSYINGVCSRCGATPVFLTEPGDFPEEVFAETTHRGKCKTYHFGLEEGEILPGSREIKTREDTKIREMVVYTPYGDDAQKSYNVLIVAPGAGHDAHQWLERNNLISASHSRVPVRELMDGLIECGYIEPLIIVVVEYYLQGEPEEIAPNYAKTLRERVLPFLAENYATYASFDEKGAFVPAPEHFAFAGGSFGAMIGWQFLPDYTDLFSYWAFFSGGYQNDEELTARIQRGVSAEHPIHYLYAGDGMTLDTWAAFRNRIEKLEKDCACFEEGKNICFFLSEKTGHNYAAWDIEIYNCLQLFFKNRYVP